MPPSAANSGKVRARTSPRLAAAKNDHDRRAILVKEMKRLKQMVKREMPRALRRMKGR